MVGLAKKDVAKFWNMGFVTLGITISDELCTDALKEVDNLVFDPIFRKVYSKTLDYFRLQVQAPVSGRAMAKIHEIVSTTIVETHAHWEINASSWNALKSLPGGRYQAVHRDFPTFETARALIKNKLIQGSIIVALMDNTRLHVYPDCFGGHADREKRKTITLKQGQILFFRGDLAHAGDKYTALNIRLHCYVQVDGINQKQNSTEAVVFQTFRCDKCLNTWFTRRKLAAHRRTCSAKGHIKCPYPPCMAVYDKRNSLNQHTKRHHKKRGDERSNLDVHAADEKESSDSSSDSEESDSEVSDQESESSNSDGSRYGSEDCSPEED